MNYAYKGRLHQFFEGLLFALYAWNAGPVYGTDTSWSMVYIGREFPFSIYLSL